jgi:hypothetical protein
MGARTRTEIDARVDEIADWTGALITEKDIAAIAGQLHTRQEWARRELAVLMSVPLAAANERLDSHQRQRHDDWPGALLFAMGEADVRRLRSEGHAPPIEPELKAELHRRKAAYRASKQAGSQREAHDAERRFFAQFENKTRAELRAAVGDYVTGTPRRERSWAATLTFLGRPSTQEDAADQPVDGELIGALQLAAKIDEHLTDISENPGSPRLLSVSAEHEIRDLLKRYVWAVRAKRRRDRLNAVAPFAAFGAGFLAGVIGDPGVDLFGSLVQVLPVLLLALVVEVGFLADAGVSRVLTAITVLLVSLGVLACLCALVFDTPGWVTAGLAVGATTAGLAGLVVAVLSRPADPRDLFRTA